MDQPPVSSLRLAWLGRLLCCFALFAGCDAPSDGASFGEFRIGATQRTLALDFELDVEARANPGLDATDGHALDEIEIAMAGNTGRIVRNGQEEFSALAYLVTPRSDPWDVYQVLAVSEQTWLVMWFYCSEGRLDFVFQEGTDGTPMVALDGEGTCNFTRASHEVAVELPATAPLIAYASSQQVFASGDGITLEGEHGSISVGDQTMRVLPIGLVDCSLCDEHGWYELHSLLWNPDSRELSFVIFYRNTPVDTEVRAMYGISLPSLTNPLGEKGRFAWQADWQMRDMGHQPEEGLRSR